jgi:YbbR domain-containing protein
VYGVSVTPATVTITGARSRVDRMREVRTENISLANQRESFRTLARLSIDDSSIHVMPAGPVEVAIQLGMRRQLQTVARVPIAADDPAVNLTPSRLTVSVLVPASVTRPLAPGDFEASVTTRNVDPARKEFPVKPEVKLNLPAEPGLSIMEIKPSEVTVRRTGNN